MKKNFLTFYGDRTGGAWMYICAESANDVLEKYPKLEVLDKIPDWFTDEKRRIIETVDIEDPPGIGLRKMRGPLPKVHLELRIVVDDAAELKQLVTKFGMCMGFVLGDVGPFPISVHGYKNRMFTMLLTRPDMDICVDNAYEENRFRIEICNAAQSPDFEAVAEKLEALLRDRWPNKLRIVAGD